MTRLRPQRATQAIKEPLLKLLLRETCDIDSARNEFRWLKEHAIAKRKESWHEHPQAEEPWRPLLRSLCMQRAKGKPLQYILGSEFFGDLEIACRPGVLIPRRETAASVTHLAKRLCHNVGKLPSRLRVLDLCTGTGCIPLLFKYVFLQNWPPGESFPQLELVGVDISVDAVELAEHNRHRLSTSQSPLDENTENRIRFLRADILHTVQTISSHDVPQLKTVLSQANALECDVIISNPPYISPQAFKKDTQRSVRRFEPRTALVPPPLLSSDEPVSSILAEGDSFYPRLLQIAQDVNAKIILMEVGDMQQAVRVAKLARSTGIWEGVEIWRDGPDDTPRGMEYQREGDFEIKGTGHGRSVHCWRGEGGQWLSASRNGTT